MPKRKNEHFAEMKTFACVFEPGNDIMMSGAHPLKGKWHKAYFGNDNPITLELGCGKGEYTLALAEAYPNRNFIGIDVKGARMWRGSKTATDAGLRNVAFLRTKIEFITTFFKADEVSEIWLTFSDPQLKDHKGSKRLSSARFLEKYAHILSQEGSIHVKTDSAFLYKKTIEVITEGRHKLKAATMNLYGSDFNNFSESEQNILNVKTHYEKMFLKRGRHIHYIHFKLNEQVGEAK